MKAPLHSTKGALNPAVRKAETALQAGTGSSAPMRDMSWRRGPGGTENGRSFDSGSQNGPKSGNERVRERLLRPLHLTLVTAVAGGVTTLLVSGLALVNITYRSPSLHVALETVVAVIAVLATHLVHGRFRERSAFSDLVLFYAFAVFAVTNLLFSAVPAAAASAYPDGLSTWAPTVGTLIACMLLVWAAFASDHPTSATLGARVDQFGAVIVVLATIGAISLLAVLGLPPHRSAFSPSRWGWDDVLAHPEVALQALICVLFFVAGLGFARKAEVGADGLMSWLAAGSILGAFARLNYFIFPSLYSDWIFTGDILRVSFYLLLFIGAAREIRSYQRLATETAVLEERRRIARDLHDGMAQELAYIASQTRRLAEMAAEFADDRLRIDHLAAAAERALDESRRAIAALTLPIYEPLHVALAHEAEEVAVRVGAQLDLDLDPTIEVDPATRETLLRIAREAVANAARHGQAAHVSVQLTNGRGLRLRVTDDGTGFDPVEGEQAGFGLKSMQARVKALGGDFTLVSNPGHGTQIEVVLP